MPRVTAAPHCLINNINHGSNINTFELVTPQISLACLMPSDAFYTDKTGEE